MKPVIARSAGLDVEDMTFLHIEFPGNKYYDAPSSSLPPPSPTSPHRVPGEQVLRRAQRRGPPSRPVHRAARRPQGGRLLAGPRLRHLEWLRKRGYTIVEVEHSEQAQYAPANVLTLEPGLVVMHAEATRSIANVRAAGVEVIEAPYSEFMKEGGGLHCSTGQIWREKGPYSTDA